MKRCSVDKLEKSLCSLAALAQKRMIDDRSRLSATIDIDAEGQPKYVNWECRVPSGDGKQRQQSLLKIPWESFYTDEPLSITELSVEFECTIHQEKAKDSTDHYILKPHGTRESAGEKQTANSVHLFKIALNADNEFSPERSIDSQNSEEYFEKSGQSTHGKSATGSFMNKSVSQIITLFKRLFFRS